MGNGKDVSDKRAGERRLEADRNTRADLKYNPGRAIHNPTVVTRDQTVRGSAHKGHNGK